MSSTLSIKDLCRRPSLIKHSRRRPSSIKDSCRQPRRSRSFAGFSSVLLRHKSKIGAAGGNKSKIGAAGGNKSKIGAAGRGPVPPASAVRYGHDPRDLGPKVRRRKAHLADAADLAEAKSVILADGDAHRCLLAFPDSPGTCYEAMLRNPGRCGDPRSALLVLATVIEVCPAGGFGPRRCQP